MWAEKYQSSLKKKQFSQGTLHSVEYVSTWGQKKGTPVSNMRKKEKDNFDLFILLTTWKVITVTLGNLCKGLYGSISNECEKKGAEIEFT